LVFSDISKKNFTQRLFLLIGAIVVDYYFVLKYSDDFFGSILSYTMFFDGIVTSYTFNIILWFLVFMASIVMASAIKVRQSNKGIKLNSITSIWPSVVKEKTSPIDRKIPDDE
jgi:RsiW-degrading membrane proteinase PrsW (M82 family)